MVRCVCVALIPVFFTAACGRHDDLPPLSFDGPSTVLEHTVVLATLDEPFPEGKNAMWSASFVASWKELMDFAGEPIALSGDPPMAQALNDAPDCRPVVPAESLYTFAGHARGALDNVRETMAARFPDASLTILPELEEDGIIAYAYLQAEVPFTIPYFQQDDSLTFTSADGKTTEVTSFGIRKKDTDAYLRLREQVRVIPIVEAPEDPDDPYESRPALEYALDLDIDSEPNQIIVARTTRESTLKQTIEKVEAKRKEVEERLPKDAYLFKLGVYDTVFIPDIAFKTSKRFTELEGRIPSNARLESLPLELAIETVHFRLSRSGAEIRSEAAQHYQSAARPQDYVFDRPFLIYMKKRGESYPYFAMWVDNAELLQAWK